MSRMSVDPLTHCPYRKYAGKPWTEVVEINPGYVRWLIGHEGPAMSSVLQDRLTELLEEAPEE